MKIEIVVSEGKVGEPPLFNSTPFQDSPFLGHVLYPPLKNFRFLPYPPPLLMGGALYEVPRCEGTKVQSGEIVK